MADLRTYVLRGLADVLRAHGPAPSSRVGLDRAYHFGGGGISARRTVVCMRVCS
jgi:hypothetical protein